MAISNLQQSRRRFVLGSAMAGGAALVAGCMRGAVASGGSADPAAPYETPYKYGKLVLEGSYEAGAFDEKAVDCPFVFYHDGQFNLLYTGWDGTGYQTGRAVSEDLINWKRAGIMLARDPDDPITRYNISCASILRENELYSPGRLIKVDGRYLAAWHAYPNPGYEQGSAVIGLAWSEDLVNWERTDPILRAEDGADWERGGLYKPYIVKNGDTYLLYYNAKTTGNPWKEQTGLAMSKDLKSWTRYAGNPIIRNGEPGGSGDSWFASDPVVYTHNGEWSLFYFGRAKDGKCREYLSLGNAPYHFDKVPGPLIDIGAPGSIDEHFAHKPSLVHHDGVLYHFYTGVSGKYPNDLRGITVARSKPW
ncbi:hypothetical protein KY084_13010 [Stakelama sp. CBK3Z-3]|uniref:Glycosyl hydrolase family 32 N-terminal domain-containing protein n=1 Tax=Stakelama flava TaxID=2860338 RepID=A0ABS6XNL2_9SPHN|nr:hypothetical protein [Stakelama flava]MBW4331787.1 hypothetical protein [Stakelama flava]